jgi:hypothetical protein
MSETEILTTVEETTRGDDEYVLSEKTTVDGFIFRATDESFILEFVDASAYIAKNHEWADFYDEEQCIDPNSSFTISNEESGSWPHWVFEELAHIEQEGELRPVDDYEENYQLSEMRGIKGAEI